MIRAANKNDLHTSFVCSRMPSTTVGIIGTGIMGKPMAKNILEAEYTVIAHNRSPEPVEELLEQGAESASSPKGSLKNPTSSSPTSLTRTPLRRSRSAMTASSRASARARHTSICPRLRRRRPNASPNSSPRRASTQSIRRSAAANKALSKAHSQSWSAGMRLSSTASEASLRR